MGFPSPATDYIEDRISLDKQFISRPQATYFLRAGNTYWRAGIKQGALLIVDRYLAPCDGSAVVCCITGELHIRRFRLLSCSQDVEQNTRVFRDELIKIWALLYFHGSCEI